MCNPVAVAWVSLIFSVYSTNQQARSQDEITRYNVRVNENEAQRRRNIGTERENMIRERTARLAAKQTTQLGAANVELGYGSAAQLIDDTFTLGEADALRERENTEAGYASLSNQAILTGLEGQAEQDRLQQEQVGSILTTGSQLADKWYTPDSSAIGASAAGVAGSSAGSSTLQ